MVETTQSQSTKNSLLGNWPPYLQIWFFNRSKEEKEEEEEEEEETLENIGLLSYYKGML